MTPPRLVGILLLGLATLACHPETATPVQHLPVVRTQSIVPSTHAANTRYSAVVRPNRQVELDFKLAGYVRQLGRPKANNARAFQEGDQVGNGEVLAVLDSADYSARGESARAAVMEAEVAFRQAERDRIRAQALAKNGSVAPVELELRTTQEEAAAARLARAQATLREANLALADTTLRAPFSGVILNRSVELGAFVTARTPGYVIADTSSMKVVFGVPDVVACLLQVGQQSSVELPSLGTSVTAPITRLSPAADQRSRLFEVEIQLPNDTRQIKTGLAATVILTPASSLSTGAQTPLRSLVHVGETGELGVFVVENQGHQTRAKARRVQVLSILGDDAIVSGLTVKDTVVTLGASLLHDGDPIRIAL